MRNRELIDRFIRDNFNLTMFDLIWKSDYLAKLVDINGEILEVCSFNPEEIWTSVNGVLYLKYKLVTHSVTGTENWQVLNN